MPKFSMKEKRSHYNAVAKGEKKVKADSKFSKKEQIAYARGQADARNEEARVYAFNHSTNEQRKAYAEQRKKSRQDFLNR